MLKFLLGAFIGGIISFAVFAICSMSKNDDQSLSQFNDKSDEQK